MPPVTTPATDVRLALPPLPESGARARRALVRGGLDPDLDHTVTLLVTELISNAIKHAGLGPDDRIVVLASLQPDFVRVEVHDGGPGFDPEVRHATKGHGLRLVDTLASRWGVEHGTGTRVWFEVDRRRRRFGRE
jgi:two-component sensor histidine kinase